EWLLLLGVGFLVMLAIVQVSLITPYYSAVKAFYGLCALVPLCAFAALGFEFFCRWSVKFRAVVCVLAGLCAINGVASFWIVRSSTDSLVSRAGLMIVEGRSAEAAEVLKQGLQRHPQSAELRHLLICALVPAGKIEEAAEAARILLQDKPNDSIGEWALARALPLKGNLKEATEHWR